MDSSGTVNYVPILIIFLFASGFAALIIAMPRLLARKRPTETKSEPYECGVEPVGSARERQSVKFYLVAMIFLLFDIEAVFLVPWAVVFTKILRDPAYGSLRYIFYGEMMLFIFILFVGLVYVWRKGLLNWTR
jgi:NADH-quinone oxidoreductase subunit A